jgi:RNA polymerase subunit RPABC4/transcription elongation factor Spt4
MSNPAHRINLTPHDEICPTCGKKFVYWFGLRICDCKEKVWGQIEDKRNERYKIQATN